MEQAEPEGKSGKRAVRGRTAAHRRRKRRQFGEKQSFCDKNNRNRKKFSSQTPKSLVSENRRIYDWSTKQFSGWSMKKVLTTCGYCGCGCNLYLTVEGGRITGVLPKPDHPVSQGMLCSKGWQGHRPPGSAPAPSGRRHAERRFVERSLPRHCGTPARGHPRTRPGQVRHARLGALHQRRELPCRQTDPRRDRFPEHRSLRAPLTQPHRSRSGYSIRLRGGHQRP